MLKRSSLQCLLTLAIVTSPVLGERTPPTYEKHVLPVMRAHCFRCHNAKKQEGEVRLDNLDPDLVKGKDAVRWHHALDMINQGNMPPEGEKRPDDKTLELLAEWIQTELVKSIKAHRATNRVVMRRMTRRQYTHTLQQLLHSDLRFGDALPKDAKSKSGFLNNANVLQITPLHLDYYEKIAREALRQTIFTERPKTVRYRITLGTNIGQNFARDKQAGRFGGFVSQPVDPRHLVAHVLNEKGQPIDVAPRRQPFGNVLHNLGVDMRGSKKERYEMSQWGMLLDSGLPHVEKAPGAWHGPSPNLKMLIRRDFPTQGPFAFRVKAARRDQRERALPNNYRAGRPVATFDSKPSNNTLVLTAKSATNLRGLQVLNERLAPANVRGNKRQADLRFTVNEADLYQIDFVHGPLEEGKRTSVNFELAAHSIKLNKRINGKQRNKKKPQPETADGLAAVGIVALPMGSHVLGLRWSGSCQIARVVLTRLPDNHAIQKQRREIQARRQASAAASKGAVLQVSLGNRTDDGQDAQRFADIRKMTGDIGEYQTYEFVGRLENLPTPQLDLNEMTSLSNIMVLTVWNGDFVKDAKNPGTSVAVSEMEFEAPYYPQWPPQGHREIFFESPNSNNEAIYAREVLQRFMTRAFRRPLRPGELELYYNFWKALRGDFATFEGSIRETLVGVLCSPKFIYLAEADKGEKKSVVQREYELASKLSYFLWNGPPDAQLLALAQQGKLRKQLRAQVQRMVQDKRSWHFVEAFCNQWLKLNRHHEMQVDIGRFPAFTRFVKEDMTKETYHFLNHVMQKNLDIGNLIDSDFVVVNQNLAEFYGIPDVRGTDFRPVAVPAEQGRGGLLTQGSFLSGHSDGKQAHPIKRAVWLMERLLGDSPPPPPPNVPDLDPKDPKNKSLSIARQLALHRDSTSCRNCHKKLDPYGLIFEDYNGAGLLGGKPQSNPDTTVELPSGAKVNGVAGMKAYILESQRDKFTGSLVEHLMTFALGRDMSFVEEQEIEAIVKKIRVGGYRFQTVLEEITASRMFLE